MPSARDLARGRSRLVPLIAFALREGWSVSRSVNGRLTFDKAGLPPIFTGPVPTDRQGNPVRRQGAPEKCGGRHG